MAKSILQAFALSSFTLLGIFLPAIAQAADSPPSSQELREVYNQCAATCIPLQLGRDTTGYAKTDAYLFEAFCACQCARITSRMSVAQFSELRKFTSNDKPLIQLPWYVELSLKSQKACTTAISEE